MDNTKNIITLWHSTEKQNILKIMGEKQGLRRGVDGYIYFCESPADCLQYAYMYHVNDDTPGEYAVIPVKFTQDEFDAMKLNFDNNPDYTPDAYAYDKDVPADKLPDIPHLDDVLVYVIGGTPEQRAALVNESDVDEKFL